MDHEFRFTSVKIARRIELVRSRRFRAVKPFGPFHLQILDGPAARPCTGGPRIEGRSLKAGDYWCGANTHFCLRSRFDVPRSWAEPALFLPFGTIGDIFNHPEAVIYIDGQIVGSADRHHHTIVPGVLAAGRHEIALYGWTGLTSWPMRDNAPERLMLRQCLAVDRNAELEAFLAHAGAALETAGLLESGAPVRTAILDVLDAAFVALDTRAPMGDRLHASVPRALEVLRHGLARAGAPLRTRLVGIGHAHMDIAYLWTVAESRAKSLRTFSNVLRLMDAHHDFHFTHSQPQLYEYFKSDHPALHARLREKVAAGQWEPVGGMWVEADTNMPGAEALVRQILLGRSWFAEEFGAAETPILWLPDTFGFSWCLPQLMKLSGLEMLLTNKLNWNQHSAMPSSTTWWEGMDGSRVLLHILTTPRPVRHLPFPTNYKSDLSGAEVLGTATGSTVPALRELPVCFGFGDGGGGPTEELIARARAFAAMPAMPQLRFGRAADFLEAVGKVADALPVYRDELYFEGHRGVLTSQAWIKKANRQAEAALHRAELLAVLTGHMAQLEMLTRAWKLLCLNQFHDTLSGTAITDVFCDARKDFNRIFKICRIVEKRALAGMAGPPGVLNPSPLPRHAPGFLAGHDEGLGGAALTQPVEGGQLVDLAPLAGYATGIPGNMLPPGELQVSQTNKGFRLENAFLCARIGLDGALAQVYDKTAGRDLLAPGQRGNQLWAYEDRPLEWDAWDIDPFYEDRGEEITHIRAIGIVENGPLRVAVRIERVFDASTICQDIRLTHCAPRLEFATHVEWHARHILLKAVFPLSVQADRAFYDIQWGQISRPTARDTIHAASRFEVCGQKWAALHDGRYAIALLNDGKYGHEARRSELRLTLLRAPTMPDPQSDQGVHRFLYALLPQAGSGFETIRAEAEAINHPLLFAPGLGALPQIAHACPRNIVIETIKPSEDGRGYVLRLYEAEGRAGRATITFAEAPAAVWQVNLLEQAPRPVSLDGAAVTLDLAAHQIVSLRVIVATI